MQCVAAFVRVLFFIFGGSVVCFHELCSVATSLLGLSPLMNSIGAVLMFCGLGTGRGIDSEKVFESWGGGGFSLLIALSKDFRFSLSFLRKSLLVI